MAGTLSVSSVDIPITFQDTALFSGVVTFNVPPTFVSNTALGNVNISGVTAITGNLVIGTNSSNATAKLQVIDNNATTILITGEVAEFAHNLNSYAQIHMRNASAGTNASGDIVVTSDVGDDFNNFVDLGINSSGYSQPSFWTINQALDAYLYAGSQNLSIGVANTGKSINFFTGGTLAANERVRITQGLSVGTTTDPGAGAVLATSSIKSSSASAGVGYTTGAGGAVTQLTSKTTAVTLNAICGQITTVNTSLAAGAEAAFTLNNTAIEANDVVIVNIKSGATAGAYLVSVGAVAAGSCSITLSNASAGALAEAVVLQFAVIKSVIA
jgi:hypothetical protein